MALSLFSFEILDSEHRREVGGPDLREVRPGRRVDSISGTFEEASATFDPQVLGSGLCEHLFLLKFLYEACALSRKPCSRTLVKSVIIVVYITILELTSRIKSWAKQYSFLTLYIHANVHLHFMCVRTYQHLELQ